MMQLVTHYLVLLADWLQPYLHEICMAQVATLLVVYCSDIDRALRRRLKPYPFVVRVTGFVLLNAFGYGYHTVRRRVAGTALPPIGGPCGFQCSCWFSSRSASWRSAEITFSTEALLPDVVIEHAVETLKIDRLGRVILKTVLCPAQCPWS